MLWWGIEKQSPSVGAYAVYRRHDAVYQCIAPGERGSSRNGEEQWKNDELERRRNTWGAMNINILEAHLQIETVKIE